MNNEEGGIGKVIGAILLRHSNTPPPLGRSSIKTPLEYVKTEPLIRVQTVLYKKEGGKGKDGRKAKHDKRR